MNTESKWPWGLLAFGVLVALLVDACGGGGGGGGTGPAVPNSAMLQGYVSPASFNRADNKDTASLIINPPGSFSGSVSLTIATKINVPAGVKTVPATVHIVPQSTMVKVSGSAPINVPINISWTSWAPGVYEADVNMASSGNAVSIPLQVTVTAGPPPSPLAVTTWHNDTMRTGGYPGETVLNTSNVSSSTFGRLFAHATDGGIEAQPLYMPGIGIAGKGTHNVVFVATLNAYVYAFDADNAAGANASPLWTANLGPAAPVGTGGGGDRFEQGIASTPVIDPSTNTMYVVSKNGVGGSAYFRLHALDIASGHEKFGAPVKITGEVTGTKGGVGGQIILDAEKQYQRCGLLLLNGVVYIGIGGLNGDTPPCRGWVLGYNAATLQQTAVFTTEPDSGVGSQTAFAGGGIWMSGGGIATDGTYLYVATGNGDFDVNQPGGRDYGDSVLKLLPSGKTLTVADYFTPYNQKTYNDDDLDLGSGCPMLVPESGSGTPLLVQPSKASILYVLDLNSLGKFDWTTDHVVQKVDLNASATVLVPQSGGSGSSSGSSGSGGSSITGSSGGSGSSGSIGGFSGSGTTGSTTSPVTPRGFWGSTAYYSGSLYFTIEHGSLYGYRFGSGGLSASPIGTSSETYKHATPSISYNAKAGNPAATAIVWAVEDAGNAELCAYKAATMEEIYKSAAGSYMKFGVPTIANGKAYVPCQNGLYVYGTGGFGPLSRPHP